MSKQLINISSGHLGNGLTIWEAGTNNTIAFIDKDRTITYRCDKSKLHLRVIREIEHIAKYDDRNISVTQSEKVFTNRPKDDII